MSVHLGCPDPILSCGWHSSAWFNQNQKFIYAYAGTCCASPNPSPNGNPGLDGQINVLVHELTEAATNPLQTSWYVPISTAEQADLCSGTYVIKGTSANGAKYTIAFGGYNYYIQTNWDLGSQSCSMTPGKYTNVNFKIKGNFKFT